MTTQPGPAPGHQVPGPPEPGLDAIISERRQLINLTYRMLGSLAEAEDVVQETYARWYAMTRPRQDAIETPGAWLTTVASRICLNLLGSARARRERYVGDWIPEPLPERTEWISGRSDGRPADPPTGSPDESVSMAFLVVLEELTPAERVAFILHDVFRYPFAEVGEIVGRTPAAAASWPPRPAAGSAPRRPRPARPLSRPASSGPSGGLGGQGHQRPDRPARPGRHRGRRQRRPRPGIPGPVEGGEQIARAWIEIARNAPANVTFLERTVNGQPGLVAQETAAS
jgi:RNA polymerase sigma-70 factor (ECF subfamily)